jgi:hypothetical protein
LLRGLAAVLARAGPAGAVVARTPHPLQATRTRGCARRIRFREAVLHREVGVLVVDGVLDLFHCGSI